MGENQIDIVLRMQDQATAAMRSAMAEQQAQITALTEKIRQQSTVTREAAASTQSLELSYGRLNAALGAFGVSLGLAGVVSFMKASVQEAVEMERSTLKLESVLRSTGDAAGFTAEELRKQADALELLTGVENHQIVNAEAVLATFTRVGREVFPQATQAALDMSAVMGQPLEKSIVQIGKALQEPITGAQALRRVGVQLTEQQQEQIKKSMELGDLHRAQAVILRELQTEFGGAAAAMQGPMSRAISDVTIAWKNLKEEIGQTPAFTGWMEGFASKIREITSGAKAAAEAFQSVVEGARIVGTLATNSPLNWPRILKEIEAGETLRVTGWEAAAREQHKVASMGLPRPIVRPSDKVTSKETVHFWHEQEKLRLEDIVHLTKGWGDTVTDIEAGIHQTSRASEELRKEWEKLYDEGQRAQQNSLMGGLGNTYADIAAGNAYIEEEAAKKRKDWDALMSSQAEERKKTTLDLMKDWGAGDADIDAGTKNMEAMAQKSAEQIKAYYQSTADSLTNSLGQASRLMLQLYEQSAGHGKKYWEWYKTLAQAEIIASSASAIVKSWEGYASYGWVGAAAAIAQDAVIAASAATQLSALNSQQPKAMATGGVFERPTFLVGEAGKEAFVPLDRYAVTPRGSGTSGASSVKIEVHNHIDSGLEVRMLPTLTALTRTAARGALAEAMNSSNFARRIRLVSRLS